MKVFVYGTLKKGYSNHRLLKGAEFVGNAHTENPYVLLDAGFPVMTPVGTGDMRVAGEIYDIGDDEGMLARLDQLEGEGRMYDRMIIDVLMYDRDGGERVSVHTYIGCHRAFANTSLGTQWLDPDGMFTWSRAPRIVRVHETEERRA